MSNRLQLLRPVQRGAEVSRHEAGLQLCGRPRPCRLSVVVPLHLHLPEAACVAVNSTGKSSWPLSTSVACRPAGVLLRFIPLTANRLTGIVSRGGSIHAKVWLGVCRLRAINVCFVLWHTAVLALSCAMVKRPGPAEQPVLGRLPAWRW